MPEETQNVADNQGEEEVKAEAETKVEEAVEETAKGEEQAEEKPEDKPFDFNSFEPQVRKTPAEYIAERRSRRTETAADGEEKEDYGDISPELAQQLERISEKKAREIIAPFAKVLHESADEREITDYLSKSGNDGYRKYAPVVKKYMQTHKTVTAEDAFLWADAKFGNPEERGAEKATERLAKGSKTKTSGGSFRKPNVNDEELADQIRDMTPEQFAEFNNRLINKKK